MNNLFKNLFQPKTPENKKQELSFLGRAKSWGLALTPAFLLFLSSCESNPPTRESLDEYLRRNPESERVDPKKMENLKANMVNFKDYIEQSDQSSESLSDETRKDYYQEKAPEVANLYEETLSLKDDSTVYAHSYIPDVGNRHNYYVFHTDGDLEIKESLESFDAEAPGVKQNKVETFLKMNNQGLIYQYHSEVNYSKSGEFSIDKEGRKNTEGYLEHTKPAQESANQYVSELQRKFEQLKEVQINN